MIAPNIILPFDGLNSAIPAGFTRETLLDNKYIKGTANGINPSSTGGASTHTHTSTASHSHTLVNHTHTATSASVMGNIQTGSGTGNSGRTWHTHTATPAVNSSTISNSTPSYSAFSNDPPYYTVIFIKSSGYSTIPNSAMVFSASTTRTDFDFHTASANKFLKGAGTGANAGSTGGSTTNTHTITHTHTAAHTHSGTSGGPSSVDKQYSISGTGLAAYNHTHPVTLATTTPTSGNNSSIGNQAETVQPAYRTLNAFKNASGSSKMPAVGDIALWLGTLATIPVGWKLCDGSDSTPDMRGRYYKNPSSASASATGGSNTHSHAAQGHTHTIPSHTHTASFTATSNVVKQSGSGNTDYWSNTHTHGNGTVSSDASSLASANTTANSSSNEPLYRTVAFIQFEFPPVIPNPILMMMVDTVENWA